MGLEKMLVDAGQYLAYYLQVCLLFSSPASTKLGPLTSYNETKPQLYFAAPLREVVAVFLPKNFSTIWSLLLWEAGFSNFLGKFSPIRSNLPRSFPLLIIQRFSKIQQC